MENYWSSGYHNYISVTLQSESDDRSLSSSLRTPIQPISPNVNFVEENGDSGQSPAQLEPLRVHSPLQLDVVRGNSIDEFSIKNMGSKLEGTINRWASEVLRIAPAPAAAVQEAVLTDLTAVGESAALFTDVRLMMVQSLLRHAMAEMISDGIINSVVVTNSADANLEYTRMHERLHARDPTAAAVWRRHTFSAAVEVLTPEMMRMIFEDNMPSLAALLPDSAEDPLGTRAVLQDALQFSRMLHSAPASAGPGADAFYRSFVPELASTLYPPRVEAAKRCRRSERGEVDYVGATIFPGLVKVLPMPPGPGVTPGENTQTVVRRAMILCECALLATSYPVSAPPPPLTM